MNSKKFIVFTFSLTFVLLLCVAVPIIVVDPFFHYHAPREDLSYNFYNQRYVTDGILKNFDYDAIIIGTSMTDNFKKSDMDEIFGTNCVKVPLPGASYKEVNQNIAKAISENEDLKIVVRGLDFVNLYADKDEMGYDEDLYPDYLYDNNIFNDVYYVLDKEVLTQSVIQDVILHTNEGQETTNFDDYSSWYLAYTFSKEATLRTYERPAEIKPMDTFSEEYRETVYGNVMQNIVDLAKANPDVEFYYFFTPYSIAYFDREYREGRLVRNIDSAEYATELILECPNIKLYSFFDIHEIICDLDFYKDIIHYSELINRSILVYMKEGTGLLTKDNYKQHFDNMRQFYLNYDYDSIFN